MAFDESEFPFLYPAHGELIFLGAVPAWFRKRNDWNS